MENQSIETKIREIASDTAAKCGVEFVQAEIVGAKRNPTVRIYIDKPDGVTLDDCSTFSRNFEAVLDADDFIPSAYLLEVSSPGLERELYSLSDFERFAGERAKVKVETQEGKKSFIGRIVGVEDGKIVFEDKAKGELRFPHEAVIKANLRVDLEREFKKR